MLQCELLCVPTCVVWIFLVGLDLPVVLDMKTPWARLAAVSCELPWHKYNHYIHFQFLIIIPSPEGLIYHCLSQSLYNMMHVQPN